MPAPAYAQYLVPQQRQGEQVPDTQIVTQGPFSSELSQPYYNPAPVKETGYGGPGHALLSFANNFLAGASKGRLRAFQESEKSKQEHERNFDATVQHIIDSPNYKTEFKEQVMQQALAAKAGAGHAALGAGGKGGGKDDHPAVSLARSIFTGLVGPSDNKKHVDIGPEHVSNLITAMHDPTNMFNAADAVSSASESLGKVIDDARLKAATLKVPLVREDLYNHPEVQTALQPLRKQGIEPMNLPAIQSLFGALPARQTPEQVQETELRRVQTAAAQARLAHEERLAAGKPLSGGYIYNDEKGNVAQTTIQYKADPNGTEHAYFLNGDLVPKNHPVLANGRPVNPYDTAQIRATATAANAKPTTFVDKDTQQVMRWDPVKQTAVPIMMPDGKGGQRPVRGESRTAQILLQQDRIDNRVDDSHEIRRAIQWDRILEDEQDDLTTNATRIKNPKDRAARDAEVRATADRKRQAWLKAQKQEKDGTPAPPVATTSTAGKDPATLFWESLVGGTTPPPVGASGGNPFRQQQQ